VVVSVLGTLCGQELHLARRGPDDPSTVISNSGTAAPEDPPTTLTFTGIFPPAGNKTQSVTEVYTTTVDSRASSSSGGSGSGSVVTISATTIAAAAATSSTVPVLASGAHVGVFANRMAQIYLALPILFGVFIAQP